ncbi:MAG: type II secretion system protein [Gemmiger sp.]|nr:type II secretion system protein [Gemmiger sp.]
MFEKIRKMKNQKGFTLVELIVVLVILAILAAMLVPALTGYIDKANNEKIIATTRQVVMAAQTEVSEAYASKTLTNNKITIASQGSDEDNTEVTGASIVKLAEVGDVTADKKFTLKNGISSIEITYTANGHVSQVVLTQGTKTCTYNEDSKNTTGEYTSGNYGVSAKAGA